MSYADFKARLYMEVPQIFYVNSMWQEAIGASDASRSPHAVHLGYQFDHAYIFKYAPASLLPSPLAWSGFATPLWTCGACGWGCLLVDGVAVFASSVESYDICKVFEFFYCSILRHGCMCCMWTIYL